MTRTLALQDPISTDKGESKQKHLTQQLQLPQENDWATNDGQQTDKACVGIVLSESIDDTYEPTASEIIEYAEWLGMDLKVDQDLLWIAYNGLKAPLPENWYPCKTNNGKEEIFYFNIKTGESIWDHPYDMCYRQQYQEEKTKQLLQQLDI